MERVIYTECASTTYVGQGNWVQKGTRDILHSRGCLMVIRLSTPMAA